MSDVALANVIDLIEEYVDLTGITLDEHSEFGVHIPITSQDMLRLTSRLEARFRFRFLPGQLLGVRTLGDLVAQARARCASARVMP